MSGGVDSTLVALLCLTAFGADNVYTLHMPYSEKDEDYFNSRSMRIAEKLKVHRNIINISNPVDELHSYYIGALGSKLSNLNLGNMKSRIRVNLLYALSGQLGEQNPR